MKNILEEGYQTLFERCIEAVDVEGRALQAILNILVFVWDCNQSMSVPDMVWVGPPIYT